MNWTKILKVYFFLTRPLQTRIQSSISVWILVPHVLVAVVTSGVLTCVIAKVRIVLALLLTKMRCAVNAQVTLWWWHWSHRMHWRWVDSVSQVMLRPVIIVRYIINVHCLVLSQKATVWAVSRFCRHSAARQITGLSWIVVDWCDRLWLVLWFDRLFLNFLFLWSKDLFRYIHLFFVLL